MQASCTDVKLYLNDALSLLFFLDANICMPLVNFIASRYVFYNTDENHKLEDEH